MNNNSGKDWFDVFTVVEGVGTKDDYWLKVGRMFPHRNGDGGYNIMLNALPLNNKLIIKPRKRKEYEYEDTTTDEQYEDLYEGETPPS